MRALRVILIKPSKYAVDGFVDRFRRGFMPNTTLYHLASMTPRHLGEPPVEVHVVDEYVETDLDYLQLLRPSRDRNTLLALVGVQSHQLHRSLDLAALARHRGVSNVIIGGPHPMTCETFELENRGISFCRSEAELTWDQILRDASTGELRPVYGEGDRLQGVVDAPVVQPPNQRQLGRYAAQMFGVYPARGCPYRCSFCSVIKIAGRVMRSQPVATTMATLRAAKASGVLMIHFTTDNFNKYPDAPELLQAIIDESIDLPFFVQCDTQIVRQPELLELLARAGCYQIFLGVESLDRSTLLEVGKNQNRPDQYREIQRMCSEVGIGAHFSNIIGFPNDTRGSVENHLASVRALGPELASFYILTPFPGTEMYDDFRGRGLLNEPNLDRYDATCPTWQHPHLTSGELLELLHRCHRAFYAAPDVLRKSGRWAWRKRGSNNVLLKIATPAYSFLARLAAHNRQHPLSGGIGRTRLDHSSDYSALRHATFGFDLAPLPDSLADEAPSSVARTGERQGRGSDAQPGEPIAPARVHR